MSVFSDKHLRSLKEIQYNVIDLCEAALRLSEDAVLLWRQDTWGRSLFSYTDFSRKVLTHVTVQMWLIEKKSAAYKYEIPDNDIFYIVASSGIYPDLSDIFDDVTTNWIGESLLRCLVCLRCLFRTLRCDAMRRQAASCFLLQEWDSTKDHLGYMRES